MDGHSIQRSIAIASVRAGDGMVTIDVDHDEDVVSQWCSRSTNMMVKVIGMEMEMEMAFQECERLLEQLPMEEQLLRIRGTISLHDSSDSGCIT